MYKGCMLSVCGGQLWERPKFGIPSRVSNLKGRWMETTHLCVNCEFLSICAANAETKFKHCLVWGPSRGHVLMKHSASHSLSIVRYCEWFTTLLVKPRPRPEKARTSPTTEKYKLINNTDSLSSNQLWLAIYHLSFISDLTELWSQLHGETNNCLLPRKCIEKFRYFSISQSTSKEYMYTYMCVCMCVCVCMYVASLVAQMVKNLPAMQETPGSIPQSGRCPAEGNGNLLQYSCLENSTDRSLAGYSPWGHRELDTTEQLAHPHIGIICIFIFF